MDGFPLLHRRAHKCEIMIRKYSYFHHMYCATVRLKSNGNEQAQAQRSESAGRLQFKDLSMVSLSRPATATSDRGCGVHQLHQHHEHALERVASFGKEVTFTRTDSSFTSRGEGPQMRDREGVQDEREDDGRLRRAVSAARGLNTPISFRHALFERTASFE